MSLCLWGHGSVFSAFVYLVIVIMQAGGSYSKASTSTNYGAAADLKPTNRLDTIRSHFKVLLCTVIYMYALVFVADISKVGAYGCRSFSLNVIVMVILYLREKN